MADDFKLHLELIASNDVAGLIKARESYGTSWRNRGGVGAFMMLARKWDRLENACKDRAHLTSVCEKCGHIKPESQHWLDLFSVIKRDRRAEGIIDDIRDLRRYLMLVEEFVAMDMPEVAKERPLMPVE